jgi:hypothetical protein
MDSRSTHVAKPDALADWGDVASLQQRLAELAEKLGSMVADVGRARQVIEYDSDLKKRALARATSAALAGGESYNKAEAEGRSNEAYHAEIKVLAKQLESAYTVTAEWEATKCAWETARSLLSMQKEQIRL